MHIFYTLYKQAFLIELINNLSWNYFHYVPLHTSKMGKIYSKSKLPNTESLFQKVVRLPLFPNMSIPEFNKIEKTIKEFFKKDFS